MFLRRFVVRRKQLALIAKTFNQPGPPVSFLNEDSHFPADGVPRTLSAEESETRLRDLVSRDSFLKHVEKKLFHFLQVVIEVCEVLVPACAFVKIADCVRVNIRTTCCGEHRKALAESSYPVDC